MLVFSEGTHNCTLYKLRVTRKLSIEKKRMKLFAYFALIAAVAAELNVRHESDITNNKLDREPRGPHTSKHKHRHKIRVITVFRG